MKSTNQEALKLGTKSDAVRTKLINRTSKCEALAIRGQAALAQEVVQTVDLPHPIYIDSAEGPYLTDLDGNKYVDMSIMGIGTNILGYGNSYVDNEVRKVVEKGNQFKMFPCIWRPGLKPIIRTIHNGSCQ